jgi:hypothetical protein
MANGSPPRNRSPKHKIASTDKLNLFGDDNNLSLSPLFDIFDHQLQYSIPSCAPSMPYEPYPYHIGSSSFEIPTIIQDNARKRQRRQTAGNLVVNTFFNRGSNTLGTAPGTGVPAAAPGTQVKVPKKKQSTAQPRPLIAVPPNGIGPVLDPNVNDVLSGRGGRINAHVGNVQFREIVAERKKDYLAKETKKLEKAHIAADIVYFIRRMDPPGRFLKEDSNGAWWDIGDQKAIKKVGQALREDAPEIRDPDEIADCGDQQQKVAAVDKPPAARATNTETTPTQTNRSTTPSQDNAAANMPIPPLTTSGSGGSKPATAVSSRGGKLTHSSSSSSVRSGHGGGAASHSPQQPISFHIDIRPPETYQSVVPQQLPPRHTPFYGGGNRAFRGGIAQRVGAAVSGAAAAVMKQQTPGHEFEVPAARNSGQSHEEAFGRMFHSPPDAHVGDSSSAVSGMSGISALTDPMSSVSNSDIFHYHHHHHHGPSLAARQAHLDRIQRNWASQVATSDNTPTLQLLNASTGIGSSLNNSTAMRIDHLDDNMSWTHSLQGGGIPTKTLEDSGRDDSVLFGGSGSQLSGGSGGNLSFGALSATSGSGLLGAASKHSRKSGIYRGAPRNSSGLAAYYPGDLSVTSGMSIASAGVDSLPSMSELSENLVALDLANNTGGSILEEI